MVLYPAESNRTGLQPASRPVEQSFGFFGKVQKTELKYYFKRFFLYWLTLLVLLKVDIKASIGKSGFRLKSHRQDNIVSTILSSLSNTHVVSL